MNTKHAFRLVVVTVLLCGCLPANLDKYRSQDNKLRSSPNEGPADPTMPPPGMAKAQTLPPPPAPAATQTVSAPTPRQEQAPARASIYAVDKQTFRFAMRESDVWDTALNVLLRNYNLTIVDRQSGIIATEWDTFFLNNAVYRNKVSVRIARVGGMIGGVDVTIHNSVERLRDASQAAATVGAVWLPAQDPANELSRIVQNMALVLNQPPPVLPPSANVARTFDPESANATR